MKHYLFIALSFILLYSCNQATTPKPSKQFQDRMEEKLYPFDGYYKAKNYPFETFGLQAYRSGLKQAVETKSDSRAGEWTQQGPGNIGGRINTIAINPDNSNEMMLGYSLGGIFRTENKGASWEPIFDNEITLSLSDIAYDPQNSQTIYAGTGDMNVSGFPVIGNGIYKSTDGGDTWVQKGLAEAGIIAEVIVSSQNSDIVYAAAMGSPLEINNDRGLYKSIDGGETWEQVLFINGFTGIIDIEVSPTDDNILYAASWTRLSSYTDNQIGSGITRILKSTDGGENWDYLLDGLPDGTLVRPGLAMDPNDHDKVYAMFTRFVSEDEELPCTDGYYIEGIYKTEDGGDSFTPLDLSEESGWRCSFVGGFSWYFGTIKVHPITKFIYVLGVDMMVSRDDGQTWEEGTPPWWTYEVHADKHDLAFDETDLILATDGGAYKASVFNTEQWEDIEDIVSTQFYRVGYNPHTPDLYYGGAQDNGTTGGSVDAINEWPRIFGGDGFGVQFHPTDPERSYVETQRGRIYKRYYDEFDAYYYSITDSLSDFGSVNWDMPYFIGAADPDKVYCGREKVFRLIDPELDIWEDMSPVLVDEGNNTIARAHNISALAQSTIKTDMFFAGTSDGYVWRTMDDGESWNRVGLNLPERYYSDVRPSPNDAARVYASITGYKNNDNTPYIYMSQDSGATFISIAGDMPQVAINDILIPPNQVDETTIVVGTDAGVYVTLNTGENWFRLGNNMPIMPIYDMDYNVANDELIAGTHARGIWTIPMADLLTVSTKEPTSLDADVYPTLVDNVIYVSGKQSIYGYKVIGLDGSLFLSGNIGVNEPIDMSSLRTGYYIVALEKDGRVVSKKVVKS